jgi:hypothetical protein
VDIRTCEPVPNRQNGTEIDPAHIEYTRPANFPNLRPSAQTISAPIALPPDFDPTMYLRANPDVAAAKIDPAAHWVKHGRFEGRRLRLVENETAAIAPAAAS